MFFFDYDTRTLDSNPLLQHPTWLPLSCSGIQMVFWELLSRITSPAVQIQFTNSINQTIAKIIAIPSAIIATPRRTRRNRDWMTQRVVHLGPSAEETKWVTLWNSKFAGNRKFLFIYDSRCHKSLHVCLGPSSANNTRRRLKVWLCVWFCSTQRVLWAKLGRRVSLWSNWKGS